MSAGCHAGSARGSVASCSRRGGGWPTRANRTCIRPFARGVRSSRMAARCESARETNVSTATRVRRAPVSPLVAGAHGAGAHVQHLPVAAHRAGGGRAVEPPLAVEHRDRGPGRERGDPGHVARERSRRCPPGTMGSRRRRGRGSPPQCARCRSPARGSGWGRWWRDGRRSPARRPARASAGVTMQNAARMSRGSQEVIMRSAVTLSGAKGTMRAWPPSLRSG